MAKKIAIGTKEIIVPEKQDIKNQISEYGGFTTLDYTLTAGDFEGDLAKIEMPINENTKLYIVGETEGLEVEAQEENKLILRANQPITEDRALTIVYSESAIEFDEITHLYEGDFKEFFVTLDDTMQDTGIEFTQKMLSTITLHINDKMVVNKGIALGDSYWYDDEEMSFTYGDNEYTYSMYFYYDDGGDAPIGWFWSEEQIKDFTLTIGKKPILMTRNEATQVIESNVNKLVGVEVQDREFDVQNIISGANAISSALYNFNRELNLPIILGTTKEPQENSKLDKYTNSYALMPMKVVNGDYVEYHFDTSKWPFSEMVEVVVDNNVFIKIPKMYIKLEKDGDIINNRYISDTKIDGDWLLSPAFYDYENSQELDYILVGKYNGYVTNNKLYSQSGEEPTVSTTITNFRTYATNQGSGYHLFDMHVKFILETLYLIVFGNTHPDTYFPQGWYLDGKQNTGVLDGMTHHTGYTTGLDNYLMKFMGIENYFSNIYTYVDGVKTYQGNVYVCDDYNNYNSDNNVTNYNNIGEVADSGYISKLGTSQGLFSIPKATDGNGGEDYYQNYCNSSKGGTQYYTLYFGRYWDYYVYDGLFRWDGTNNFNLSSSSIGSRLVKKPL